MREATGSWFRPAQPVGRGSMADDRAAPPFSCRGSFRVVSAMRPVSVVTRLGRMVRPCTGAGPGPRQLTVAREDDPVVLLSTPVVEVARRREP